MKWIEAKVLFESSDRFLAVEVIAGAFNDAGIPGVVVEGPDEAPLEGWAPDIVTPSKPDAVIGYIAKNLQAAEICRDLENRLSRIDDSRNLSLQIAYKDLDEEDWAESWKTFFHPQKISRHFVVKPTWRDYSPQPGEILIHLDPGMAFGTGTHPTTSLCVRMIETHLEKGDLFLDIGTGSGILMIAAAKLGATYGLGIDNDAVAVDVANANFERNGLDPGCFRAICGNLAHGVGSRYTLVTANILSEVILALLDDLIQVLLPGGIFICSGIVEKNGAAVVEKMKRIGFIILSSQVEDGWMAIAGRYLPTEV